MKTLIIIYIIAWISHFHEKRHAYEVDPDDPDF